MQRLRHALVVRLVAFLVGAGVLGVLVPQAVATPAHRAAAWLRAQAVDADAEALDAALALALSRGNLAPRVFFDVYAEVQPRFGTPSGAWFGMADVSFRTALDRLRRDAPKDLNAPSMPQSSARWTTAAPMASLPASPLGLALPSTQAAGLTASRGRRVLFEGSVLPIRTGGTLGPASARAP